MTLTAFLPVNIPGYWALPVQGTTVSPVVAVLSVLVLLGILAAALLPFALQRRRHTADRLASDAAWAALRAQKLADLPDGDPSAESRFDSRAEMLAAERAWSR